MDWKKGIIVKKGFAAVIGLGTFGSTVCNELYHLGNDKHHKILEKIGADRIIHPEQEIGIRVANQLDSGKITDYIELSKDYSIIELVATKRVSNRSLVNLDIRAKFGCTILAIRREENVNISPMPDDIILIGDILIVMGHVKNLKRFEEKGV